MTRFVFVLARCCLVSSFTARAQDPMDAVEETSISARTPSSKRRFKSSNQDLKLLRGIIFGRHGRVFKDNEIKVYLEEQSWYKPNPDFKNSMLNDIERRNLDLIRIAEAVEARDDSTRRHALLARPSDHAEETRQAQRRRMESVARGSRSDSRQTFRRRAVAADSISKSVTGTSRTRSTTRRSSRQSSARTSRYSAARRRRQRNVALLPGDMEFFENRTDHRTDVARAEPARVAFAAKRGLCAPWPHVSRGVVAAVFLLSAVVHAGREFQRRTTLRQR